MGNITTLIIANANSPGHTRRVAHLAATHVRHDRTRWSRNMASELAAVGSFLRRIEGEIADLEERDTNMEAERSRAMDTDVAEAMLQLTTAETFYRAALRDSARGCPSSAW